MPAKKLKTLEVRSRQAWRKWLEKNHDSAAEIWLVFHKLHTGITCIDYHDALDEALCFGWIDSLIRRLDADRYARKFTPRKADSRWSTVNRKRYAELKAAGLLAKPGLARPPTDKSGDAPESPAETPRYIAKQIKPHPKAWAFFKQLAPGYRRLYIRWIDSAKRQETKDKRLREVIVRLAAGEKPGLK